MSRAGAVLLMLLLAVPVLAWGQTAPVPAVRALDLMDLGAPAFNNFTARDGLPEAIIVSTCVDREGFVWGASPVGVFRYDGRHWVASDDPAMAHSVDSVFVDHQGTLWAAFRSNGLARYDGRRWHVENTGTGLPADQVRRFAETVDARGVTTLWALTWDRGLMRLVDGRWQTDPGNASLPADPVMSMAQTQQLGSPRRQWAGTNAQGLWYRDEGRTDWRRWEGRALDAAQIEFMLPVMHDGQEELWISVFAGGLWRMRADGLRHWSKQAGDLPSNELYNIVATPLPNGDHAIWVASRAGLIRVHDDHLQTFDRRHGMHSDVVRDIAAWRSPDGGDILWMATESGVSRTALGASPWSIASLMGASSTGVYAALVEPDGRGGERLWVGSSGEGLALYEGNRWHHFSERDGIAADAVVGMLVATPNADGSRTYWVGTRGGALLRRRPGETRFEPVDTPWKHRAGQMAYDTLVRTIDGHEEQWFGTRATGIYRLREGHWTRFPSPEPNSPWRVIRLRGIRDASGRSWLWAATNLGLARFDGQRWETFGRDAGLPEPNLIGLTLIPDAQGRQVLWLGTTSAGTTRVDISDPRHPVVLPNDLPAPPDPTAYSAQQDHSGRIYICTNNGVQLLTPTAQGYDSRVFNRSDGMIHQECNSIQFVDAHDRFWTTTLGGLAVYDPHRELHDTQPKPLKITALQIDDQPVAGPALDVPAGAREIRIDYALLSWYREADSRFRTQLLGYEAAPSQWSEQTSRIFNALPPGRYQLRVEASDHANNLSTPVEVAITLRAQWWQTLWFRIAVGMAALLLIYLVVMLRTRHLRAQRSALEARVHERTFELNAANARLLDLSYRDELTGLDNRRRLLEALAPPPGSPPRQASLILLDVDLFKSFNDRFGHLAGDQALRSVAAAMRDCASEDVLVARYGGEEFACLVPCGDPARALALAECIREAVAACQVPVPDQAHFMHLTVSAGVASGTLAEPGDGQHLLRLADIALYQAKNDGRNRVRTDEPAQADASADDGLALN